MAGSKVTAQLLAKAFSTSAAGFADLRALLAADAIDGIRATLRGVKPDFDLNEVAFLPVIPNPDKILCVGLNYESHRLETGRPATEYPAIFTRFADTQIGHEQPI